MQFETLASGYYLEALCVVGDTIWLSDVTRGGIRRIGADGHTDSFFTDQHMLAAVIANADGRMLISGLGGIRWLDPRTGAHGMLISEIDGQPIGGVNEMTPDGKGGLYFGTIDLPAVLRGEKPGPSALYRLEKNRRVHQIDGGLSFSNGLGLSPDGARLYHNESFNGVFAYEIASDGKAGPAQKLLDKYDCDGMAMDRDGGAWICGFSTPELIRIAPNGNVDRRITLPGQASTNVCFAGPDGRDLYVTTVTAESVVKLVKNDPITVAESKLHRARGESVGLDIAPPQFQLG
jgi:sugar lactone lactonase YvrE